MAIFTKFKVEITNDKKILLRKFYSSGDEGNHQSFTLEQAVKYRPYWSLPTETLDDIDKAIELLSTEPITIRYETDSMSQLRQMLLTDNYVCDSDVDAFKACLIVLEKKGFVLIKKEKIS